MRQAIDLHNMHTGIHELYLITHKPKTVIKHFTLLQEGEFTDDSEGYEQEHIWNFINANTEYYGEINYRYIKGGRLTHRYIPVDDCHFQDSKVTCKIIARFHF